jgi:hypothetical protein
VEQKQNLSAFAKVKSRSKKAEFEKEELKIIII